MIRAFLVFVNDLFMVKVGDRVTKFDGYFPFGQGSPGIEERVERVPVNPFHNDPRPLSAVVRPSKCLADTGVLEVDSYLVFAPETSPVKRVAAELRTECLDCHKALVGYGFPYLGMTVGRLIYQSHVFRDAWRGDAVGLLEEA